MAQQGFAVRLYEMKPQKYSPAHHYSGFAELVCSNSLKADRTASAAGLLKAEMRRLGSLLLTCADETRVPAGGALAVDRTAFSDKVTQAVRAHANIEVVSKEMTGIPDGPVIVATGPLTSDGLAQAIGDFLGADYLSFYDAAAPIVTADSLNWDKVFRAARYGRGEDDYVNCSFSKEEYEIFYQELIQAQSAELKEFEKEGLKVYEGCMPVEVMAGRGPDTLRFGPLKPVGLRDPRTGHRPWAVVQLRHEDKEGTTLNLVGFQTNLKFPEQKRVFSLIPGLEQAEFTRYGVMHRNTFLNSPQLLDATFALKQDPRVAFAGQMTGVEGYMESAASGILAAQNMARRLRGEKPLILPPETMLGALSMHISKTPLGDFQPMGANMGILPPLPERVKGKQERYALVAQRALEAFEAYLETL